MTFLIVLLKLYTADTGLLEYDNIHSVQWYLQTRMIHQQGYKNLKSHIIQNILIELIQYTV
jgi:hypothetical protein